MASQLSDLRPGTSIHRVKELYEYGMITKEKMLEYIKDYNTMNNVKEWERAGGDPFDESEMDGTWAGAYAEMRKIEADKIRKAEAEKIGKQLDKLAAEVEQKKTQVEKDIHGALASILKAGPKPEKPFAGVKGTYLTSKVYLYPLKGIINPLKLQMAQSGRIDITLTVDTPSDILFEILIYDADGLNGFWETNQNRMLVQLSSLTTQNYVRLDNILVRAETKLKIMAKRTGTMHCDHATIEVTRG